MKPLSSVIDQVMTDGHTHIVHFHFGLHNTAFVGLASFFFGVTQLKGHAIVCVFVHMYTLDDEDHVMIAPALVLSLPLHCLPTQSKGVLSAGQVC